MLNLASTPISDRVGAIAADVLRKHGFSGSLDLGADLGRCGMTSIDMVELMLGVEAEFDLAIPSAEITPQNFRSVESVAALVSRIAAD